MRLDAGNLVTRLLLAAVVAMYSAQPARGETGALNLAKIDRVYADPASTPGKTVFTAEDEKFLDDLERRGIQFYLDGQDPVTGLMPDRSKADGSKPGDVASTASVGFGLTAMCVGVERGWLSRDEAYDRSMRVLKFLRDKAPQERGHFYHFLKMSTGEREWKSEVSNIDTALLMAGVLTVAEYFPGTELSKLAHELYDRVDWGWLMQPDGTLSMGWKPESGFIKAKWDHYSEGAPLILLLAMGSKTHPLPPEVWQKWRRTPTYTYAGLTYMQCPPLFTHQFPQCWFDLRNLRDDYADYFRNAQLATIAQRQWTIDELSRKFPAYGPEIWGLTASDWEKGYTAWGGPPQQGDIDGTVVPCAPAGSLAFEPRICLDALMAMKREYGDKGYLKYGFVDAFNPNKDWYNPDVIGIDVGPTVLMAENARSGFVWKTFMSSPAAQKGLKAAGFRPLDAKEAESLSATSVFSGGARQSSAGADR